MLKNSRNKRNIIHILALGVLLTPVVLSAASFSITPSSGDIEVGDTINATINLHAEGEDINALSGNLLYPSNVLTLISTSTSDSVVPYWIEFYTQPNIIGFAGMVPNPGYTGSSGKVFSATFQATREGSAQLSFADVSILANDGLATELSTESAGAVFTVVEPPEEEVPPEETPPEETPPEEEVPPEETPPEETPPEEVPPTETPPGTASPTGEKPPSSGGQDRAPAAPELISFSHPESDKWYIDHEVVVEWGTVEGLESIRTVASPLETAAPTNVLAPDATSQKFTLDDGVWYINVQFKNAAGWGDVGSLKIQVDSLVPSKISVRQVASEELRPGVFSSDFGIEGYDIPSGMEYFEISLDNEPSLVWRDDGTGIFRMKNISPGEHIIVVKGYDKAGNSAVTSVAFEFTVFDPIGVGESIDRVAEPETRIENVPLPRIATPEVVSVVSYAGFGAGFGQLVFLGTNIISFADFWLIIMRLLSTFMSFFRRRKSEPWGVVYDSVTKQPLDPAYVVIKQEGEQKGMAITDLDGRYGFLVSPGRYTIEANKTHYAFPSVRLAGKKHDELYNDLYFGEEIDVTDKEKDIIRYNIPMDPVEFDWNEFAKKEMGLFYVHNKRKQFIIMASNTIFYIGLALSSYVLWHNPSWINAVIFGIYAVILLVQTFWRTSHPITKVIHAMAEKVVPFAIIKAYLPGSDRLIRTIVADENGHFYLLTPPGTYYFTVEAKQPDGSYSRVHRTPDVELKKGVVLKNLYVHS
jgi:hypothetical protein